MVFLNNEKNGVLPSQYIKELIDRNYMFSNENINEDLIQPASIDLRLGFKAWRVPASFLPGKNSTVEEKLNQIAMHEFSLSNGAVLECGCVYIVKLLEGLNLPKNISGMANPKSSTGRLDIFARLITDFGSAFDTVPAGYKGHLYLEVSPRTFPILVRAGSRLSQLRFRRGSPSYSDAETKRLHEETGLVNGAANIDQGLGVSIDLRGGAQTGLVGYRGKRHAGLIDVDQKGALPVSQYWEPIYHDDTNEIILDPDEFYILASREARM